MKTTKRSLATALAVGALLMTTACSGSSEPEPEETITQIEGVSAPSPDADQSVALLAALAAIDPTLDEGDKSVRRARDMCSSVVLYDETGSAHSTYSIEELVRIRFTADHLTDEQTMQVVDAIRTGGWCE
jgi:hypothetical protein